MLQLFGTFAVVTLLMALGGQLLDAWQPQSRTRVVIGLVILPVVVLLLTVAGLILAS